MLRRFLAKLTSDSKQGRGAAPQWVAKNQQVTNNMTEIQILSGHTDIVRSLVRINASRFASASDDCTIIIWSIEAGEPLMRLYIWDLNTGTASKVIPDCHQGSIKCLLRLDSTSFMSAGNDKYLNIWKTSGELVDQIERSEQENLNCLLMISNRRVVTAGNGTEMVVYWLAEKRSVALLVAHREPVRCLINLNANMFVSASIDGQIIVWSATTLTSLYEFNYHKTYINTDHVYIYNVHQLVKLSDQYLAACIGSGYAVYKIGEKSAEIVMECLSAHSASVLAIAPLYYGTALVTSSADSTIRLWGSKVDFQFRAPPVQPQTNKPGAAATPASKNSSKATTSTPPTTPSRSSSKSRIEPTTPDAHHHHPHNKAPADPRLDVKYVPAEKATERRSVSNFLTSTLLESDKPAVGIYPPRLIGDMCCHSDQVNIVLPLSPFAFASASSDGCIIIWRDGRVESAFRSELSTVSIRQWHTRQIEMSILEATSSQYASTEAKYALSGSVSSLAALVEDTSRPLSDNFVVFGGPSSQSSPTSTNLASSQSGLPLSPRSASSLSSNPPSSSEALNGALPSPRTHSSTIPFASINASAPQQKNASTLQATPNKPQSAPNSGKIPRSPQPFVARPAMRVPPYIADNAYYMFYELNYTLEQVQDALLAEGNSEAIVVAALAELQQ